MRVSTTRWWLPVLGCGVLACSDEEPPTLSIEPPVIESIEPRSVTQGRAAFDLIVNGRGFDPSARVMANGVGLRNLEVGSTRMRVAFPDSLTLVPDTFTIRVVIQAETASEAVAFVVVARPPADTTAPPVSPGTISAAGSTTCALSGDGDVYCWGAPWAADPTVPTRVELPAPATSVRVGLGGFSRAGGRWACALLETGEAWCWGRNDLGQLGRGVFTPSAELQSPAPVIGDRRFQRLAAGGTHACGVTMEGDVLCWGDNGLGQVGRPGGPSATPVLVPLDEPMMDAAASWIASCALARDSTVWCWGRDDAGGPRALHSPYAFHSLTGGTQEMCASDAALLTCWSHADISGGSAVHGLPTIRNASIESHGGQGCATRPDRTAICWGDNRVGQTGTAPHEPRRGVPPEPVDVEASFIETARAETHACGITVDGRAMCWGYDGGGALGSGGGGRAARPQTAAEGLGFAALDAGPSSVCGTTADQRVLCWGTTTGAPLGEAPIRPRPTPVPGATGLRSVAVRIDGGCGLDAAGRAVCWDGTDGAGATPTGAPIAFDTLVAGGVHACGLDAEGAAWCWGEGDLGQLGHGRFEDAPASAPVRVAGGHRFTALTAAGESTCGIDDEERLRCWGSDRMSQLGAYTERICRGDVRCSPVPLSPAGDHRWRRVDAGGPYTCGVTTDGASRCWGGFLNPMSCSAPGPHCSDVPEVLNGAPELDIVRPADGRICGLDDQGRAWCWGVSATGSPDAGVRPEQAALLDGGTTSWTRIVHTRDGSCGLTTDGRIRCWGDPAGGTFGDGWLPVAWSPQPVAGGVVFGR